MDINIAIQSNKMQCNANPNPNTNHHEVLRFPIPTYFPIPIHTGVCIGSFLSKEACASLALSCKLATLRAHSAAPLNCVWAFLSAGGGKAANHRRRLRSLAEASVRMDQPIGRLPGSAWSLTSAMSWSEHWTIVALILCWPASAELLVTDIWYLAVERLILPSTSASSSSSLARCSSS
mmetsp:Transcript_10447/g.26533  ORF Transcript_10447/g.26533 Transcript_10447/m.26533 type:complete len:178 (-) Transcript_10447:515-1048(-)